jgi:hypothetical protein
MNFEFAASNDDIDVLCVLLPRYRLHEHVDYLGTCLIAHASS